MGRRGLPTQPRRRDIQVDTIVNFLLRLIVWLLRIAVFIALFGLAIKNSGPMELRFFLDQSWTAPVSVVILAVFALGVAIGLSAALGVFLRPSRRRQS